MLTRSIPNAEITISLPIAAFVPTWNWDNWELKRREGKMQSGNSFSWPVDFKLLGGMEPQCIKYTQMELHQLI